MKHLKDRHITERSKLKQVKGQAFVDSGKYAAQKAMNAPLKDRHTPLKDRPISTEINVD